MGPRVDTITFSGPWFLGPQAAVIILPVGVRVARLCQDVPKSPAGAPQSLSRSWTQSGGRQCCGATVLVHPFPSSLYTNRLLTPFFFPPPSAGRNLICHIPGSPALVSPAQSKLLIRVCVRSAHSTCWTDLYPPLSDATLCSLRSPPYLTIPAWSWTEPQGLTPSRSLGDAEQVVTPIPWTAACWAYLGTQGKVPLLHREKRCQSHPWAGPLMVGANQTKVLMSRS